MTDDSGVNMIPDGERLPPGDLRPTPADRCHWCGGSLPEGRGRGSSRRFCCGSHRTAFHSALRRAANLMIDDGRLSVADLHGRPLLSRFGPADTSVLEHLHDVPAVAISDGLKLLPLVFCCLPVRADAHVQRYPPYCHSHPPSKTPARSCGVYCAVFRPI